jgi:hypothetical protein
MFHLHTRRSRLAHNPRRRNVARRRRLIAAEIGALEILEDRCLLTTLAPVNVKATALSASSVALSWNASTDPTVNAYDVYQVTVVVSGGGKGSHGSRTVYTLIASNLQTTSDTFTGLSSGSTESYAVTALSPAGQSPYSATATTQTWYAPRLLYGPYFKLSSGYETLGPAPATVGLITQVTLYMVGNPLTYSKVSGPSTLSINSKTGVVTYTPASGDVGTVSATLKASNSLGSVTQTIQFDVTANSNLPAPKLLVSGTTATYNGQGQYITVTPVGSDGVTPVSGTYQLAINGSATNGAYLAGTYPVLVTFTSSDPNYGNATLLTNLVIGKAATAFSNLSSQTIAVGAPTITVSGKIASGTAYPGGADYIAIVLNGVTEDVPIGSYGNFSATFATGGLPVGSYNISYAFAGDQNLKAHNAVSTLTVVPLQVPQVTQNPTNETITAGDFASFTATATGSPTITVQWQVSTDGGQTFTNIAGATSDTLTFYVYSTENGYKYRAVFTNSAGVTFSSIATLTVEADSGGGG